MKIKALDKISINHPPSIPFSNHETASLLTHHRIQTHHRQVEERGHQLALRFRNSSLKFDKSDDINLNRSSDEVLLQSPKSFNQICQAFRLAYLSYLKAGLVEPNEIQMRYSILQLLPTSWTMVAMVDERVVSTGTIVANSLAGLPMGSLFHKQIEDLCSKGRFIAEATLFASEGGPGFSNFKIALKLLHEGIRGAYFGGADDLFSVVHPRHVPFYVQQLGFEVLSETDACGHVCNNPGVLLHLDLQGFREGKKIATPMIQREALDHLKAPEGYLHPYRLSEYEALALMLLQPRMIFDLSTNQRKEVQKHFPMALQIAESRLRC